MDAAGTATAPSGCSAASLPEPAAWVPVLEASRPARSCCSALRRRSVRAWAAACFRPCWTGFAGLVRLSACCLVLPPPLRRGFAGDGVALRSGLGAAGGAWCPRAFAGGGGAGAGWGARPLRCWDAAGALLALDEGGGAPAGRGSGGSCWGERGDRRALWLC